MLYHYSRIENILNIITTQRFRLTNISCFKDVSEFIYTVSLLSRELSLSPAAEREFQAELSRQNHRVFVGCFCSESDRLFLWKEYGGYNIGFAEQDLRAMVDYQAYMGHVTSYSNLLPCEYDEEKQGGIIRNALNQWKERGNVISGKEFSHLATLFKHPSYSPEREMRLVVKLRETEANVAKYWELPLRSYGGFLPIRSITIGPTEYPEKATHDLRISLRRGGLEHIDINPSNIPYQEYVNAQRFKATK
jgi:hypothetical protein